MKCEFMRRMIKRRQANGHRQILRDTFSAVHINAELRCEVACVVEEYCHKPIATRGGKRTCYLSGVKDGLSEVGDKPQTIRFHFERDECGVTVLV
jgi:hypothetical protein